ncbi:uncharacterized protein LOC111601695 [Drosophila hydei]|uniref:Uncharacterized protein LOC111601695 n=1 Tax=Drosophila hydei TaxID=7224 RepID=A0A6J1M501_DROHY|nr:uncharacterized protein LOC111601695 [Drosophila hydei]
MAFGKCFALLLLVSCLAAFVAAQDFPEAGAGSPMIKIIRRQRSPQHGSVVVTGSKDHQTGRQLDVQYNHNLYTSRDGRGSIDAYANANRNFDQNRNNFGGGIQGKWRF